MVSNVQLLKSRHHGVEIGPQVFWQLIVPGGLTSARVHGFQGIQTVTLGSRRKLHLCFVLEFVLPIRAFLMTIARDERVMLELGAQAVWQFPTFSRKEVQLVVHMSRSLSDQLLRVGRSADILDFQHVTAFLHSNVCSQLAHDRDWCQWRNSQPRALGRAA